MLPTSLAKDTCPGSKLNQFLIEIDNELHSQGHGWVIKVGILVN